MRSNKHKMANRETTKARLHCIQAIVSTHQIDRQDVLLSLLRKEGFTTTQSMLSRDLRQLRISKMRRKDGKSVYVMPDEQQIKSLPTREEQDEKLWRMDISGNLMVLHTPPGHAGMIAYEIDSTLDPMFLGTVAGDDTILVVLAEGATAESARQHISKIVPKIK